MRNVDKVRELASLYPAEVHVATALILASMVAEMPSVWLLERDPRQGVIQALYKQLLDRVGPRIHKDLSEIAL